MSVSFPPMTVNVVFDKIVLKYNATHFYLDDEWVLSEYGVNGLDSSQVITIENITGSKKVYVDNGK